MVAIDASLTIQGMTNPEWAHVRGPIVPTTHDAQAQLRLLQARDEYDPKLWQCNEVAHDMWQGEDLHRTIAQLELKTLRLDGKEWDEKVFHDSMVLWHVDNQTNL